jgi:hypothetical protein
MNTTKPVPVSDLSGADLSRAVDQARRHKPVSDLSGPALDWAAAHCEGTGKHWLERWNAGVDKRFVYCQVLYNYSTNWGIAGPIIEREGIYLWRPYGSKGAWSAKMADWSNDQVAHNDKPLIAAMRCYVASRLGDTVEIPEELL